ncbi:glycoside hydrolase family 2 TIM barrel-domain containing protein [Litorimonas sp. RW-G-Af-16]|uniref:glycoside hydrolase family 2 TIM barrel-domain containing protein n=1 Tax=Litorimonas sp. RW-G-Af-16 TaxID=3241168 RepID=UPI00390CA6EA
MTVFRTFFVALIFACTSLTACAAEPGATNTLTQDLSHDWRFALTEADGIEREAFDDSDWRVVTVPHDAGIEDRPDGSLPFDPDTATGSASGYLPGQTAWYRRTIDLSEKQAGGIVIVRFEAVYMDSQIWVNGAYVRNHNYGYTSFDADLTGMVKPGENILSVRVQHEDPASRWYAGTGIIRPVTMMALNPVHIGTYGPTIVTPIATAETGRVNVTTPIRNKRGEQGNSTLKTSVIDAEGNVVSVNEVSVNLDGSDDLTVTQGFDVERPNLWSTDTPYLYRIQQALIMNGKTIDTSDQHFGIRTVTIDSKNGVLLNGNPILLKGGNIHHDNYMIGGAGATRADVRKLELMKDAGYNSVRNAHNPASKATLEAADRLGLLFINETFDAWSVPKMERDYSRFFTADWKADTRSMIMTSRNSPSLIMYSIGNEIPEQNTPKGVKLAKMQAEYVRELDPTRPVTVVANSEGPKITPYFDAVDIAGYNYRPHYYIRDSIEYPDRVMYGAESYSASAFEYWDHAEKLPAVIGDFVWTSVDYLGEASIGWTGYSNGYEKLAPYPWHLAYCGEIDVTGYRRPQSYYREIMWKTGKTRIAAFVKHPAEGGALPDRDIFPKPAYREWVLPDVHPSWTWDGHEGQPLQVEVYSEFEDVELFLNGESVGRKAMGYDTEYKAEFTVNYAPGVLTAVGYENGEKAAEWTLETAGDPASVQLTVDRNTIDADGHDLAYITAELVDAQGRKIYDPNDDALLSFFVSGAGDLAGVGNGNPVKPESFTSGDRTTFNGRVVAVVRSTRQSGNITVRVASNGLPTKTVTIKSQ